MIAIPKDKQKHLIVGLIVLVWSITLVVVAMAIGANMPAALVAAAGLTSAVTGEAHQWLDNRDAKARGEVPTRTVSALDALAGSAPCLAAAIALQLGYERGIAAFVEMLRWLA